MDIKIIKPLFILADTSFKVTDSNEVLCVEALSDDKGTFSFSVLT